MSCGTHPLTDTHTDTPWGGGHNLIANYVAHSVLASHSWLPLCPTLQIEGKERKQKVKKKKKKLNEFNQKFLPRRKVVRRDLHCSGAWQVWAEAVAVSFWKSALLEKRNTSINCSEKLSICIQNVLGHFRAWNGAQIERNFLFNLLA